MPLGKSKESPRETHYYVSGYNLQAVRQGPWKLALVPQPDATGGKAAADKLLHRLDGTDKMNPFHHPHGMAIDSKGNLFIADSSNQRIAKFELPPGP